MIKKTVYLLKNKNGNGMPLAAAATLVLLMFILIISQYIHLIIISAGIKDAMQKAIISTVNDNYADVYHSVREGYVAGYQPSDGIFKESVNLGDIYGKLDRLLGLQVSEGYHYKKTQEGKTEYKVYGLQVTIQNAGLGSGIVDQFEATATIQLEVPVSFLQKILPDMKIMLRMKASYIPRF